MAADDLRGLKERVAHLEQVIRWARPRLTRDVYREALDKLAQLPPAPPYTGPLVVKSEASHAEG